LFETVLALHFDRMSPELLRQLHSNMKQLQVIPSIFVTRHLLRSASRLGLLPELLDTWQEIKKLKHPVNNFTYLFLISGCARANNIEHLEEILAQMKKDGIAPNEFIYTSIMRAYKHDVNLVVKYLNEMIQAGFNPTVATYHVVITAFVAANDIVNANKYYDQMKQKGMEVDFTVDSLIATVEKSANLQRSFDAHLAHEQPRVSSSQDTTKLPTPQPQSSSAPNATPTPTTATSSAPTEHTTTIATEATTPAPEQPNPPPTPSDDVKPSKVPKSKSKKLSSKSTVDEQKKQPQQQEEERLKALSYRELQNELKEKQLKASGKQEELLQRLLDHFNENQK
jgi:pentatricopeptide repeat protein